VVKGDWQMPFAPTRIPGETGSGENRRKPVGLGRGQNRLVLQLKPQKSDKRGREHTCQKHGTPAAMFRSPTHGKSLKRRLLSAYPKLPRTPADN
jgi:hypothetical protein